MKTPSPRVEYAGVAAVLAALTLLFFWKILLTNLILVGIDVFLYFYPYKTYATETLLKGQLPLWNPHLFMGVPFLANSQVGVLYPFNWLFLWASPPKQVAYSIGLHVWLAGLGTYVFARQGLGLKPLGSFLAAMVFAFSGFLGAQVEHLNQLQVSAWLPWLLWLYHRICQPAPIPAKASLARLSHFWARRRWVAGLALVVALMLLAGHTQSVYIAMFGLGLYALFWGKMPWAQWKSWRAWLDYGLSRVLDLTPIVAAIALALLMSGAQLMPTLELSQYSIRSGGLSYREAVAFSLNPRDVLVAFLPPYGVDLEARLGPAFSEFVAYVGLLPLVLASLGALWAWRKRRAIASEGDLSRQGQAVGLTGVVGLGLAFGVYTGPIYLALYLLVPGFDLFRVPARWLLLYTFGVAVVAAIGFSQIRQHWLKWLLLALIPLELFLAAQGLRYNRPTAPEAYSFLRPAIVQLLAEQSPSDRFLSLSGIVYDPGDLREIEQIFGDQLPPRAVYDYVVAAKQKEVLFFNLPLVYGLNAIDGYDGGLLPLQRFLDVQRLVLAEENLSLDGRLREKLNQVPEGRLLSLFGVRHIITDKVFDVWLDDIFYDLQFPANLSPAGPSEIWTEDIPDIKANALGVVFRTPHPEQRVAEVVLRYADGTSQRFSLNTATATAWSDEDYQIVFEGLAEGEVIAIGLQATAEVQVRGLSLIQTANQTSRSVLLSTEGHYRFIHGGDVKVYENLDALPRGFIIHQLETVPTMEAAIARLRDPAFDVTQRAVRVQDPTAESAWPPLVGQAVEPESSTAELVSYAAERLVFKVSLSEPGWLHISDTHYPGWQATVNGEERSLEAVNVLFKAVELEPGEHEVVLEYRPRSVAVGFTLSGLGVVLWLVVVGVLQSLKNGAARLTHRRHSR